MYVCLVCTMVWGTYVCSEVLVSVCSCDGGLPFLCFVQQLSELKKENFGLKLRIYHLEEALRKQMGNDSDDWRLVSQPCMGPRGIPLTGLTTPTSC